MTEATAILHWLYQRKFSLFIAVIVIFVYLQLLVYRSLFEVDIQTHAPLGTDFKVYWANTDQGFQESRSVRARMHAGNHRLKFFIGDLDNITKLRIDPIEYQGEVTLKRISISQAGYLPITLQGTDLNQLSASSGILSSEIKNEGLFIVTSNSDGNFQLNVSPQYIGGNFWFNLLTILTIFCICLSLAKVANKVVESNTYIVVCLSIAITLAIIMAAISNIHVHPDERVHMEAVKYYSKHLLPPPVDSAEIINSFSDYGKSRLSTYEIYYPLAGYFAHIIEPLKASELVNIRSFSIFLFAILLIAAAAKKKFRYFMLPCLITPQVWYLYSYPNSDGFALSLGLFAAYQLAVADSWLNCYLNEDKPQFFLLSIIGFGTLAGALLQSKLNFYFLLFFFGLYFIWKVVSGGYVNSIRLWVRLGFICIVAISLYGGRYALDVAANGPNPQNKVNEYIERYAKPEFKPSTPMEEKHFLLYLKSKGQNLDVVLSYLQWGSIAFSTSFGSYGYTQYFGSDQYYALIKIMLFLLFGAVVIYILIYGNRVDQTLLTLVALSAIFLIAATIWSSWTEDFQAQGRYFAPVLPMVSILFYHTRHLANQRVIALFVSALFFLSVYSFVVVGMGGIAKTSFYTALG